MFVVFTSCTKAIEVKDVDFDVTTESVTYKVTDTVHFKFQGNPDNISFYSGEFGNDYQHINRTEMPINEIRPELSFTSFRQFGNSNNTLRVLISTDFSGVYDSTNIYNATWTDITSRVTLSTGLDNTPSGIVNLSDLNLTGAFYVAFRYTDIRQATTAQRTWTIRNFFINSIVIGNGASINVADIVTASWTGVNIKNSARFWTFSSAQIQMGGGPANTADNEDWAITKPIYLNKVNPDVAVGLKNLSTYLTTYAYKYTRPGTYKAVFIGSNTSKDDRKEVVRTINLTITP